MSWGHTDVRERKRKRQAVGERLCRFPRPSWVRFGSVSFVSLSLSSFSLIRLAAFFLSLFSLHSSLASCPCFSLLLPSLPPLSLSLSLCFLSSTSPRISPCSSFILSPTVVSRSQSTLAATLGNHLVSSHALSLSHTPSLSLSLSFSASARLAVLKAQED